MKKNTQSSSATIEQNNNEAATNDATSNESGTDVVTLDTQVGRPIDLKSKRQQKLLDLEIKRQLGLLKKGRPIEIDSDRQKRLAELDVKREAGLLKPGRPAFNDEQKANAERKKEQRAIIEKEQIKKLAAQRLAEMNATPVEA